MYKIEEILPRVQRHTILVAHPQLFVSSCVCKVLKEAGMDVLTGISDKLHCIKQNELWKPQFILISDDFFEETIRLRNPNVKIIILSENKDLGRLHLLHDEANALIHTNDACEAIFEALRSINSNRFYFSKEYEDYIQKFSLQFSKTPDIREQIKILSKREIEILTCLASGENSKSVSEKLFISYQTLMTHKLNISEKLALAGGRKSVSQFAMLNRHLLA
jgi:DNA-binding NarL/FixJ family response regulator